MEILSNPFNGRYWRRRRYKRLDGETARRKNTKTVRFGGSQARWSWRIKAIPKLRLKMVLSPLKLWNKVKNSYVNLMINLAGNGGQLTNGNVFGGKRIPKARQIPTFYSNGEFEKRLVYEIYKSLIASRELAAS